VAENTSESLIFEREIGANSLTAFHLQVIKIIWQMSKHTDAVVYI
jgi:hypothetical protein